MVRLTVHKEMTRKIAETRPALRLIIVAMTLASASTRKRSAMASWTVPLMDLMSAIVLKRDSKSVVKTHIAAGAVVVFQGSWSATWKPIALMEVSLSIQP